MNAEIYHSLSLAVENGLCIINYATPGFYNCSGIIINQPTHDAIVAGA